MVDEGGATASACGWQRHRACVDYRAWVLKLPRLDPARWERWVEALAALGRAEPDATGVITVRGAWGFMLIPPRGFPELRLNIYKNTDHATERRIKEAALSALNRSLYERKDHE